MNASSGVLGRFESAETARDALKALENRGVDGEDLALVGAPSARARRDFSVGEPDRRIAAFVSRRVAKGIAFGLLLGLALGVGVVAIASWTIVDFDFDSLPAVVALIGFALLGGVVGALAGVAGGVGFSESWPLAFRGQWSDDPWLLVRLDDPKARDALLELGAVEVRHADTDRVPIPSPLPDRGSAGNADLEGVARGASTLVEVLQAFARAGYAANLEVTGPATVRCAACDKEWEAHQGRLAALRRLEGASDPADMLAVAALECPRCRAHGTLVLNFGPEATEAHAATLHALHE